MSQESDDTYYQGGQFRIVKDDKGKASDIEWVEGTTHQDRTENSNLDFRPSKPSDLGSSKGRSDPPPI